MDVVHAILLAFGMVLGLFWWSDRRRASQRMQDLERRMRAQHEELVAGAVAAERARIFDDLHDDLGAALLTWVYEAQNPAQADKARALLQTMRDVVTRSRGAPGTLEQTLSEIRAEAEQRLAAAGIGLDWECDEALPERPLARERALHLYRIVREAISNAIRHARAERLRVRQRCTDHVLRLEITDDGEFPGSEPSVPGSGVRAMRQRAEQLQADIAWLPGTQGGTKVLLEVPLDDRPDASSLGEHA